MGTPERIYVVNRAIGNDSELRLHIELTSEEISTIWRKETLRRLEAERARDPESIPLGMLRCPVCHEGMAKEHMDELIAAGYEAQAWEMGVSGEAEEPEPEPERDWEAHLRCGDPSLRDIVGEFMRDAPERLVREVGRRMGTAHTARGVWQVALNVVQDDAGKNGGE